MDLRLGLPTAIIFSHVFDVNEVGRKVDYAILIIILFPMVFNALSMLTIFVW